ncbi:hypothetical protein HUJ05_011607 [Dendroctonus ponderosae]|nr:hypothetical protein HUJ05_011607 [Dendroctonus ponderosae]
MTKKYTLVSISWLQLLTEVATCQGKYFMDEKMFDLSGILRFFAQHPPSPRGKASKLDPISEKLSNATCDLQHRDRMQRASRSSFEFEIDNPFHQGFASQAGPEVIAQCNKTVRVLS